MGYGLPKKIFSWVLHKWIWFALILVTIIAVRKAPDFITDSTIKWNQAAQAQELAKKADSSISKAYEITHDLLEKAESAPAEKIDELVANANADISSLKNERAAIKPRSLESFLSIKVLDWKIDISKAYLDYLENCQRYWKAINNEKNRQTKLVELNAKKAETERLWAIDWNRYQRLEKVGNDYANIRPAKSALISVLNDGLELAGVSPIDNSAELRNRLDLHRESIIKTENDIKNLQMPIPIPQKIIKQTLPSNWKGDINELVEKSRHWYIEGIKDNWLIAAMCVVTAIFFAPLSRLICFFALAPIAVRQKPILLVAKTERSKEPMAIQPDSAVALPIQLMPGQALLAHHDYVKTVPSECKTSTQFLGSALMPFTSLAAGLYNLVRVEPDKTETVVLSSGHDGLNELVQIDLPSNVSLAVEPRNLVGFVVDQNGGVKLRRKWVLLKMQSWLKLQFRHVLVEGPVKLIIKGGRGAVVSHVQDELLISPEYVLAFSANLGYGTSRTETFGGYFSRKKSLLKDRFVGDNGFVVHQEAASETSSRQVKKSGLEGLMDGVLKAFGI